MATEVGFPGGAPWKSPASGARPGVGLEVERGHVVEHKAGRAEPGVRGAGRRQPLPPLLLGVLRQAPLDRRVRRRRDPGLLNDPQAVQLARRLNDPGQHQMAEHLVPARGVLEPQHPVSVLQGVQQVSPPEEVIGSGPPRAGSRPRPSSGCPAAIRCYAAAFSASSSASSCADPRCSISRDPRREAHTTCAAVASDVVFTVRMYGTASLYGPRLVRKFSSHEL